MNVQYARCSSTEQFGYHFMKCQLCTKHLNLSNSSVICENFVENLSELQVYDISATTLAGKEGILITF